LFAELSVTFGNGQTRGNKSCLPALKALKI